MYFSSDLCRIGDERNIMVGPVVAAMQKMAISILMGVVVLLLCGMAAGRGVEQEEVLLGGRGMVLVVGCIVGNFGEGPAR